MDECEYAETYAPTDDDCYFSRDIAWRIPGTEGLRACSVEVRIGRIGQRRTLLHTDDIANTITNQIHSSNSCLFRITCYIT